MIFLFGILNSQTYNPLDVEQYKLDNGLTVFLNYDDSQPNVLGAVVIKGGSKRDPKDATGIAHYFEHIMFKGTDKIGTINYEAEKVYLDSIEVLYDKLSMASDDAERERIQMHINELSLKSSEYAIPNEFDKIISKMGGQGVNAFTSEEMIAYFNFFPGDQIGKWLELYSHRFIHPVFRMFQSELETVYEEKNMSMDSPFERVFEELNTNMYEGFPYENTVLGTIEHLKNPSLRKMKDYFETYYVANNMALILSGNFNKEKIKPMIEEKFGVWRTGNIPEMMEYTPRQFDGRELVVKRYTPIRIGIMAYRTVPEGHPDELVLNVANELLTNSAKTGLLDDLYYQNKLLAATIFPYLHYDMGSTMILFVPKLFGKSMKNAEKLIKSELNRIKIGDFSEETLNSVKANLKKDFYKKLERPDNRAFYIMDAFMLNKGWDSILKYPEEIDKISKDKVVEIVNKYYGDNYFAFFSKTGFPKKNKLPKPNYKPISPKNSEAESDYAKMIENMPVTQEKLRFIEFGEDVLVEDVNENLHYYFTENKINNIFSVIVKFGKGTYANPSLEQAVQYLNNIGTEKHSYNELNKELQKFGAELKIYADKNYTYVSVEGMEEYFSQTLDLVNELLTSMKKDDEQLKKISRDAKAERKMEKKEPSVIDEAIYQYAVYGENSDYLRRLSLTDINKLTSDKLIADIKDALTYEAEIHYVGKNHTTEIQNEIIKKLLINNNLKDSNSPVQIPFVDHKERTVYILNDKKLIQSQISIFQKGTIITNEDIWKLNAFNEYFGGGMYSLVFQEIREFRSLAYSAWANYSRPKKQGELSYLYGSMSCQSDKTPEALQIFDSLITEMPMKEQRLDMIKTGLIKSVNAYRSSFRELSSPVSSWRILGYDDDPRKLWVESYENLTFKTIKDFYTQNLNTSPLIITVAGDTEKFDEAMLKPYGKIVEVDKKKIFN